MKKVIIFLFLLCSISFLPQTSPAYYFESDEIMEDDCLLKTTYTLTVVESYDCCLTSIARIYIGGVQHNVAEDDSFEIEYGTTVGYEENGYSAQFRTASINGPGGYTYTQGYGNITTSRKTFTMTSNATIIHDYQ